MNARDVISRGRLYINDETASAISQSEILALLNDTLNHISSMAKTIRQGISISVLRGQGVYGLPDEFAEVHSAFIRGQWGLIELQQATLDENVIIAEYGSWGPTSYDTWEKAKVANDVIDVSAVNPSAMTFSFTPTTGAARVGDEIHNTTDTDSFSEVVAISHDEATNITTVTHNAVEGNTRDYAVDDVVRLVNPANTNYAISIAPLPNRGDEAGEESLSVYVTLKHRRMTQEMINNRNDSLEIDSEMFDATVWDLAHRCSIIVLGATHPETLKLESIASERFWKAFPLVNARFYKALNLFREGQVYYRKRRRPIRNA